jgi:FAD/FMN-containing dehydrogenase
VATLPSHLLAFVAKARETVRAASLEPGIVLHPALGIAYLKIPRPPKIDTAAPLVAALRKIAGEKGGHVIVEGAPGGVKQALDVWGDAGDALPLMRKLKDLYDPNHIFNRGRFLGRI